MDFSPVPYDSDSREGGEMVDEQRDGPDPSATDLNRMPAARGAHTDTERVLAHLVEQPAPRDVLAALPEPTWEDIRTVMAPSDAEGPDVPRETRTQTCAPAFVRPQEFYTEAMRRADVREILRRLAE
jgi:hypothetical protein